MNYGATGRAAGIPKEVLLRLAGWAQERSGLYRSEWGHWSGSPPYGVAPHTLEKIEAGFRYYETKHREQDAPSR
jgi:hypothetical protein